MVLRWMDVRIGLCRISTCQVKNLLYVLQKSRLILIRKASRVITRVTMVNSYVSTVITAIVFQTALKKMAVIAVETSLFTNVIRVETRESFLNAFHRESLRYLGHYFPEWFVKFTVTNLWVIQRLKSGFEDLKIPQRQWIAWSSF